MRPLLILAACLASLLTLACGASPGASTAAAAPTPSCTPRPAGSPPAGFTPGAGGFGQANGGAGRPLATGQVESYSGGVMTIADRRTGQAVKVTVTSSTEVTSGFGGRNGATPSPNGPAPKIAKGENVTVFGSESPDGSITATRVAVMPTGQLCGRPPRPAATPSTQG